jgi:hypothetical protein
MCGVLWNESKKPDAPGQTPRSIASATTIATPAAVTPSAIAATPIAACPGMIVPTVMAVATAEVGDCEIPAGGAIAPGRASAPAAACDNQDDHHGRDHEDDCGQAGHDF